MHQQRGPGRSQPELGTAGAYYRHSFLDDPWQSLLTPADREGIVRHEAQRTAEIQRTYFVQDSYLQAPLPAVFVGTWPVMSSSSTADGHNAGTAEAGVSVTDTAGEAQSAIVPGAAAAAEPQVQKGVKRGHAALYEALQQHQQEDTDHDGQGADHSTTLHHLPPFTMSTTTSTGDQSVPSASSLSTLAAAPPSTEVPVVASPAPTRLPLMLPKPVNS